MHPFTSIEINEQVFVACMSILKMCFYGAKLFLSHTKTRFYSETLVSVVLIFENSYQSLNFHFMLF